MSIQVTTQSIDGQPMGMGGLQESQQKFAKNSKEEADEILNISGIGTKTGRPVAKDTPRIGPVEVDEYPRAMHKAGLPFLQVDSAEEEKAAVAKGYRREPFEKLQVRVEDPQTEKKMLLEQVQRQESTITQLAEDNRNLQASFAELMAKLSEPKAEDSKKK